MTNHEKAITKAYETIDRMIELGFTTKEIAGVVTGIKRGFEIAEFLNKNELRDFDAKCKERMI